jgi:beta-galactosidase
MFGSEDTNQKTTRGEYADDKTNGMCSAYNLSAKDWQAVADRPFVCGSFTWTGFDYRGEPNPFGWPDISNNTGLLDLCGFPKDKFYYFQSCWTAQPMVHLLPDNWNAPGQPGQNIRVIAFSNAKQVELFLNGRSLGVKDVAHDDFAEWTVPYEAGQLTAHAITGGQTVATEVLATTGPAARLVLAPAQMSLAANGEDVAIIPVSIVDQQGRVVPDADMNEITFTLNGGGRIAGTGNGNPADHSGDRASVKRAFHGRCVVFVQAGTDAAALQITATAPGLFPATASIEVR